MKRDFTYADLGNPEKPGIFVATNGTRVHLDESAFERWKSSDFANSISAELVHPPEHMGGTIWTVSLK